MPFEWDPVRHLVHDPATDVSLRGTHYDHQDGFWEYELASGPDRTRLVITRTDERVWSPERGAFVWRFVVHVGFPFQLGRTYSMQELGDVLTEAFTVWLTSGAPRDKHVAIVAFPH